MGETTLRGPWRDHEMTEGERLEGTVVRLPSAGIPHGNKVFVAVTPELVLAIPATAKHGHTVLERELQRQDVTTGQRVTITYHGMRTAKDGERRYRHYEVALGS